jgi:1,2-diacylglycerol 3-beta-galactosyltransferase
VRKLPVLIECNAWTLPQERYNAQWVKEKRVGIVLKSFEDVVAGAKEMLDPRNLQEFRKNVAALDNRAIFEIPEILAKLLEESGASKAGAEGRKTGAQKSVPARN